MPVDPMSSSFGRERAQRSMSSRVFQGLLLGTNKPKVVPEICNIGVRSAIGSQATEYINAYRNTVIGNWPMVYPSGAAILSSGATSVPAAPGRLMMFTG